MISEHLNLWKDPVLTDRAQKGLRNSVTLFSNETPISLGFEMLAVEQFDLKRNLLRLSSENLPVRFGLYYYFDGLNTVGGNGSPLVTKTKLSDDQKDPCFHATR